MKRQRIIKSQTKEPITIPQPEKLPEFEPIIDPNSPKIYPDENPVGNPQKESTETSTLQITKNERIFYKLISFTYEKSKRLQKKDWRSNARDEGGRIVFWKYKPIYESYKSS